jgi:hypothetical protein
MSALTIKERGKNFIIYNEGVIRIDNVRFSYPHVDKPWKKESDKGTPKYGIVGLMPKETHEDAKKAIAKIMKQLATDAKITVASDKKFLRDGDANSGMEDEDADKSENTYAGMYFVSARETNRPTLRDQYGKKLDPVDDAEKILELFYGGAWGHILIRPWVQNNEHGKRINAGFVGAMFSKDDKAFGQGRIDDSGAWGDIAEGGGEDPEDDEDL